MATVECKGSTAVENLSYPRLDTLDLRPVVGLDGNVKAFHVYTRGVTPAFLGMVDQHFEKVWYACGWVDNATKGTHHTTLAEALYGLLLLVGPIPYAAVEKRSYAR